MMAQGQKGLCACGCGQFTNIADRSWKKAGYKLGEPYQFVRSHHYHKSVIVIKGYRYVHSYSHPRRIMRNYVAEHILIAEKALGKPLPHTALVHHVNEDGTDNRPQNLVVCPHTSYHKLIHYRMRALKECGNAAFLFCVICRKWDDPSRRPFRKTATNTGAWRHRGQCQPRKFRGKHSFLGVTFNQRQKKWIARAILDKKVHYLGSFASEHAAFEARKTWLQQHRPTEWRRLCGLQDFTIHPTRKK